MTQLQLKLFQPQGEDPETFRESRLYIQAGAKATVRLLADVEGRTAAESWWQEKPVNIALGDPYSGEHTEFDLPGGGYYGVDITRPRGRDLSREFLVESGQIRTETIKLQAAAHDYLGWQQYAGAVRPPALEARGLWRIFKKAFKAAKRFYILLDQSVREDSLPGSAGVVHALSPHWLRTMLALAYKWPRLGSVDIPLIYPADLPTSEQAWLWAGTGAGRSFYDWRQTGAHANWEVKVDHEYITWLPEMPDTREGRLLVEMLRSDRPWNTGLERQFPRWLSFARPNGTIDLVSVPWAWWGHTTRGEDEQIRFLYERTAPNPLDRKRYGHLILSIQDRRWFGLLEFLASGRLSRAGSIPRDVMREEDPGEALHGKVKGPLAAVAGGIALLAQAPSPDWQYWDDWLSNLSNWFPGIPDGAILFGCRQVQQATHYHQLWEAFSSLRAGIQRGIPFFSATIMMLSLALAQIEPEIPEAGEWRRLIAPVSSRVYPDQPFTVIRL